jgi:hypothetical protein
MIGSRMKKTNCLIAAEARKGVSCCGQCSVVAAAQLGSDMMSNFVTVCPLNEMEIH